MPKSPYIVCELCPKSCRLSEGYSGDCRARIVLDGELRAATYGRPCTVHIDPIEKKPLFHFLPSTRVFSIATAGCNLHFKFCQNWNISQIAPQDIKSVSLPPEQVVDLATAQGCRSVAYTYTDPVIYFEYCLDTSALARDRGLKNVTVTAGYINRKPMEMLCKVIDASNTDVKAFSDVFYRDMCGGTLKPVLDGMVLMKERGVWLEVTNLIIPTLNDDLSMVRRLCRWIAANLGAETPVHFNRFYPMYKIRNLPPTPVDVLLRIREEALELGLSFVYVGNVLAGDASNTLCPKDGELLVRRRGFSVIENRLQEGKCPKCGTKIPGVWS
ncbi:MAG: AmmeMemoRadiSam system radical SAM enzyme [Pseudomonadota bacterium]